VAALIGSSASSTTRWRVPDARLTLDSSLDGRLPVRRAPQLGEHTEEVLAGVLGLSDAEFGALDARGTIAVQSVRTLRPHS